MTVPSARRPAFRGWRSAFVSLSLAVAAACAGEPTAPTVPIPPPAAPPVPFVVEVQSGSDQVHLAGRALEQPLVVRVTRDGEPAGGVTVQWLTVAGSILAAGATDADGMTHATWTLPMRAGTMHAFAYIEERADGVAFAARAEVPTLEFVSGRGQSGVVGEELAEPLRVRATWNGAPLAGEPVQWSFQSTPVLTDADGYASVDWSLRPEAGLQYASARLGYQNSTPVAFDVMAAPGPLASLTAMSWGYAHHWTRGSHQAAGASARDQYGNVISGVDVTWYAETSTGFSATGVATTNVAGNAHVVIVAPDGHSGTLSVRYVAGSLEAASEPLPFVEYLFRSLDGWWDYVASPASISVPAGSTVRWANDGLGPHVLNARDGSLVEAPLAPGSVLERQFATAGTYELFCALHEADESFLVTVTP